MFQYFHQLFANFVCLSFSAGQYCAFGLAELSFLKSAASGVWKSRWCERWDWTKTVKFENNELNEAK